MEIRDEKSQNDLSASENKENILEKENAKQEDAETTDALSDKGLKVKEELQKHSETANGNTGLIKEEPQDEDEKVKDLSTPSQNAEHTEDVIRKTLEETQRALKNDHQAKIPLKKREMKLSEDFDTSSMVVRNAPVAPVKESQICFDDSRLNDEKINGHVPHLTTSESETQKGSGGFQKESTEDNNSEKLPLVLDKSKERKKERKNDQTEEKMETHETRLCAEEQMEVEKSEESSATTAEENKDKSETSQSHEKTLGEEKLSSVIEESEKTPGSEELADNKKSPSSDNMDATEVNTSTLPEESTKEESMKDLPNKESANYLTRDKSVKIPLKDEPTKDQSTKHRSEEETSIEKSIKDFSKEAVKESLKDLAREESIKDLPKEASIKDLSKEKTSKEELVKNLPNEQSKKDLAEEASQKVLAEKSQLSPKDSNKDHKKTDPTASKPMETEPFQSSKTDESSTCEIIKPRSSTEKTMNTEETKPHHSSVDTTTEKEPTAIVSKTEKQCISEGEGKSIACKPSDGPQDKVQERSKSPKTALSDLEKSYVSDSTNKPSTPKTTEKVDREEKCDTAETDQNEDLETSKDKDEKGEAANSSEESTVKKSEEVKATERPNESNSSDNPPDREYCSKEGNKEKPMEVDSEISKADQIQSAVEEGCEATTASKTETDVPVDQNTTSIKQSKQDATSEEREASGDVEEKSTAAVKSSKRPGRPSKKAQESQDEDKTGEEQEEKPQQEGIRMKIKIPARRRKKELQREEVRGDSESEVTDGRCLRRSPRICRPTAKVVEIQDRRVERKQATPVSEKEKDDNEDKEDEDSVPKKPRKAEPDGQTKPKVCVPFVFLLLKCMYMCVYVCMCIYIYIYIYKMYSISQK